MKISAPIIAIMAASSSSVACAKTRYASASDDSDSHKRDPLCSIEKYWLATRLTLATLCVVNEVIPLQYTYDGIIDNALEHRKVLLDSGLVRKFEGYFYNPYITSNLKLMESDGSTSGTLDGKIDFSEMQYYQLSLLGEYECAEIEAMMLRYRNSILTDAVLKGVKSGQLPLEETIPILVPNKLSGTLPQ